MFPSATGCNFPHLAPDNPEQQTASSTLKVVASNQKCYITTVDMRQRLLRRGPHSELRDGLSITNVIRFDSTCTSFLCLFAALNVRTSPQRRHDLSNSLVEKACIRFSNIYIYIVRWKSNLTIMLILDASWSLHRIVIIVEVVEPY